MTNEIDICDHCGAKMVEYSHSLSKLLVNALVKFHKEFGQEEANLKDSSLTFNERTNFQKLKYWDLVIEGDGHSTWFIGPIGIMFINGFYTIKKQVVTFHGKVKRMEGPDVVFRDIVDYVYRSRESYAREAKPSENCSKQLTMLKD